MTKDELRKAIGSSNWSERQQMDREYMSRAMRGYGLDGPLMSKDELKMLDQLATSVTNQRFLQEIHLMLTVLCGLDSKPDT